MISLTTAAWISLALISVIWALMMKLSVRLLAKGADNGWDNAVAYTLASAAIAWVGTWIGKQGLFFAALVPLLAWTAQTIAIRTIYELKATRAWLLGIVHTLLASTIVTTLGLTVAVVVAYWLYGKIITDPMFLVCLIAGWLKIDIWVCK